MSDLDITVYYNSHRLDAMNRALREQNTTVEQALYPALDALYARIVPADEREEIEEQIAQEQAEEKAAHEAAKRFGVYHFHDADDDFHFTSELRDTFYSAAYQYRQMMKRGDGNLTLDSIAACYFEGYQPIDELTFSVLCDAMPNDQRITALIEFDLENNIVSVCDSSDNAWWSYNLKDVSNAVYAAERKQGLTLQKRIEIFNEQLDGKELDFASQDEAIDENSAPTMQM